jgi:hypothetical protein
MRVREIGLNTIVTQGTGIVVADMDGEKAMLNIGKGKYYGLDRIGSRIWELIETPRTVREVTVILRNEYDVLEENCQQDILGYFSSLHAQGLVDLA